MRPRTRAAAFLAATALLLALPACMLSYRSVEGPGQIDADAVEGIFPGATTRRTLFEAFGPPPAIVRPGTELAADPAGAAALELFSARGRPLSGRCVYFYTSTATSTTGGLFILAVAQSQKTSGRKLWVLVDDATGVVEDLVYRED